MFTSVTVKSFEYFCGEYVQGQGNYKGAEDQRYRALLRLFQNTVFHPKLDDLSLQFIFPKISSAYIQLFELSLGTSKDFLFFFKPMSITEILLRKRWS